MGIVMARYDMHSSCVLVVAPLANPVMTLQMLAFPCGVIRGGLASVGMHDVDVKGEIETIPHCEHRPVPSIHPHPIRPDPARASTACRLPADS